MKNGKCGEMKFEEMLAFGQDGEKEIASVLIKNGVSLIPLYQFEHESKAPFLLSDNETIILPDLTCFSENAFFVECKRKNQWVHFNGRVETGLNVRHYQSYKKVKEITKLNVYLFFKHENEMPGIYYNEIDVLNSNSRIWNGVVDGRQINQPLILFPKENLKEM